MQATSGSTEAPDVEFMMYRAKCEDCPIQAPHKQGACPYLHPEDKMHRRYPLVFSYDSIFCYDLHKTQVCRRGQSCPYSHNLYEYFLHPSRYRTRMCEYGVHCKRDLCFFAHHQAELRPRMPVKVFSGGRCSARRHRAAAALHAAARAAPQPEPDPETSAGRVTFLQVPAPPTASTSLHGSTTDGSSSAGDSSGGSSMSGPLALLQFAGSNQQGVLGVVLAGNPHRAGGHLSPQQQHSQLQESVPLGSCAEQLSAALVKGDASTGMPAGGGSLPCVTLGLLPVPTCISSISSSGLTGCAGAGELTSVAPWVPPASLVPAAAASTGSVQDISGAASMAPAAASNGPCLEGRYALEGSSTLGTLPHGGLSSCGTVLPPPLVQQPLLQGMHLQDCYPADVWSTPQISLSPASVTQQVLPAAAGVLDQAAVLACGMPAVAAAATQQQPRLVLVVSRMQQLPL